MKLIGISGTNGSGKDTIGEMLAEKHHWLFISVSDILRQELIRLDRPIERKNLRDLSAQWRRAYGHGILIDKAFDLYKAQKNIQKGLVIASLRNPGEPEEIHRLGGVVLWVDADPQIRYQRIYSRRRSTEDHKTFKQFMTAERNEMNHQGDAATLNMSAVKAKADIFIENNGNNIPEFIDQAEQILKPYI